MPDTLDSDDPGRPCRESKQGHECGGHRGRDHEHEHECGDHCHCDHDHEHGKPVLPGAVLRFLVLAAGVGGVYASTSVCPFCGQVACPAGLASAGIVGAATSGVVSVFRYWGAIKSRLLGLFRAGTAAS